MTQGELEKLPLAVQKPFSDLEIRIMDDIVRRIKTNGFSPASADWQISRLQQLGKSEEDIKDWIRLTLDTSKEEIEKIFSDEAYRQYMGHERAYKINGMEQIPFEQNLALQSVIEATRLQTKETFRNITNSLGFVKQDTAGRIQGISLTEFYRTTLDNAIWDIHSGAFDYPTVLMRTINDMTKSGVRQIDYRGGRHDRIDVAARRAVMTGFRQIQGKINEQTAEDLGTDSYEVTYHVGARPTHQPWQGRVWTMQQLKDICCLGSVTGLHGANCYHDYTPFIPGVSVRTYTDKQLEQMLKEENTPREYNGKIYTTYEALQQQRKMERSMRATRQQIRLLQNGGADAGSILQKKARYQGQMQAYRNFSKEMKLPEQLSRVHQDGLGTIRTGNLLQNAEGKAILKVARTTLRGMPGSITQKESAKGGIERNYYGPDGRQFKQVSNNSHGNPKMHPYGKQGEHAHDYTFDESGKLKRSTRELTERERKENSDIL